MSGEKAVTSPSGVRIAADFRDNLIIDRFDPVFADMRVSKRKHMRSENSEDAVTWNVFRTLRQIAPEAWLNTLVERGLSKRPSLSPSNVVVHVWRSAAPPPGLLETGDEGISEIDVVIESPSWVWFIEAKYRSDISSGTTTRPARDQVLRNIDVGSYYAGVRKFYFSLLIADPRRSPQGVEAVHTYSGNLDHVRDLLAAHRPDRLANLQEIALLTWADLGVVLQAARTCTEREDERGYAARSLAWLETRGVTAPSVAIP